MSSSPYVYNGPWSSESESVVEIKDDIVTRIIVRYSPVVPR